MAACPSKNILARRCERQRAGWTERNARGGPMVQKTHNVVESHVPLPATWSFKERTMDKLSLQNPLFATYVIAATLMILKVVSMSWLTVVRMIQANAGFRSPEDLRKTPLHPRPAPKQLERNEAVDRLRRIQLNDLEN